MFRIKATCSKNFIFLTKVNIFLCVEISTEAKRNTYIARKSKRWERSEIRAKAYNFYTGICPWFDPRKRHPYLKLEAKKTQMSISYYKLSLCIYSFDFADWLMVCVECNWIAWLLVSFWPNGAKEWSTGRRKKGGLGCAWVPSYRRATRLRTVVYVLACR